MGLGSLEAVSVRVGGHRNGVEKLLQAVLTPWKDTCQRQPILYDPGCQVNLTMLVSCAFNEFF